MENNYKCLIQGNPSNVIKHYSCAHILTETDNVFGEDECVGRKMKHQLLELLKSTIHYSQLRLLGGLQRNFWSELLVICYPSLKYVCKGVA